MNTKNATVVLCLLLLVVLTGCPEPPTTGRIVSLGFPPPKNADKVSLSASDAEVQDALKVVDAILVSHGFVRDEKAKRACAWGHLDGKKDERERFVSVLEIPPVVSAETAVRVQIVKDVKGKK